MSFNFRGSRERLPQDVVNDSGGSLVHAIDGNGMKDSAKVCATTGRFDDIAAVNVPSARCGQRRVQFLLHCVAVPKQDFAPDPA